MKNYDSLSVVITSFPLVLNLSWWTNIFTIAAAVINKYKPEQSADPTLLVMLWVNLSLGCILLLIHFVNLFLLISMALKKKLPWWIFFKNIQLIMILNNFCIFTICSFTIKSIKYSIITINTFTCFFNNYYIYFFYLFIFRTKIVLL
jgi:hypothetical protein